MDLREYDYITKSPDTFPRSTLLSIKKVLQAVQSPNISLIDNILENGYVQPPAEYKWHGCYRLILKVAEKQAVLADLMKAEEQLKDHPEYQGNESACISQYVRFWTRGIEEIPVPYAEAVKTQQYYDLRGASLDIFSRFIFDHPVPEDSEDPEYWYHDTDMWIDYHIEEVIELYTQLFRHPENLANTYSLAQLESGCWAMMGSLRELGLEDIIWNPDLHAEIKIPLISAMYDFYDKFYKTSPLDTSCDMWWDSLAYGFSPMKRYTRDNPHDKIISDAMFATLTGILGIDAKHCQFAALHGLAHLQHPDTERVITEYLQVQPGLTEKEIEYAKACITGDVM